MKSRASAIAIMFLMILSSCTVEPAQPPIPTPITNKATVTGRIVSINTNQPYKDATVRLAEVYSNELGEEAFALDAAHSPQASTNEQGYFTFVNVEAREYVLIIGDPMTRYVIVTDSSNQTMVFNFPPGQVTDLGEFKIDYDA